MKILKDIIKSIVGIITSPEIIRLFDKNNDGIISWQELRESSSSAKFKALTIIIGDLVMKYGFLIFTLL